MSSPVIPIISNTNGSNIIISKNLFFTPVQTGTQFIIPIREIVGGTDPYGGIIRFEKDSGYVPLGKYECTVTVKDSSDKVIASGYGKKGQVSYLETTYTGDDTLKITLSEGSYIVLYELEQYSGGSSETYTANVTYIFSAVENRLPLKKLTQLDVCDRICALIYPKEYGQKPKFRIQGAIYDDTTGLMIGYEKGTIAEELDKILAPEYAFTKMNLREMLKQVGGYIHAEPRITAIMYNADGTKWYEVGFDKYGGIEYSKIKARKHVTMTLGVDINEYCTHLDSSAENLISQIDYAQGVAVEPFEGGGKSLRTENSTVRMGENNSSFISTDKPVYIIGGTKQVICTYIPTIGSGSWDITPYIYEYSDYQNLSSYQGTYPFCKAYALYYTQGSKHIKGLFYRNEDAISPIFQEYAIINILREVTGNNSLNLTEEQFFQIQFLVTYLPIFSARIKTTKPTILTGEQSTIPYNQSANLIETRFYGEQLKGVVARLGTVEKTYTYNLAFLSDIPKVGTKFDEHYYISAVSTEILPFYIRCTVALSKDFNRLSQYIGISSNKRMWEVSEKQSQQRESIFTEYVKITTKNDDIHDNNTIYGENQANNIVNDLFNKNQKTMYPVSCALVRRFVKKNIANSLIPEDITLPVVGVAMGNSMLFSFKFEDNYSAGQKVHFGNVKTSEGTITGAWGEYVRYISNYGKFYWLQFYLQWGEPLTKPPVTLGFDLPQGTPDMHSFAWVKNALEYRKDNREIPSITYQLMAVADDSSIIIGSGLMKNCKAVNRNPFSGYELWVFTEEINTINSTVNFSKGQKVNKPIVFNGDNIQLPMLKGFKSWAIVTRRTIRAIRVEDDDGDEILQTVTRGGELCLGQNGPLKGQTLYFRVKKDIYD